MNRGAILVRMDFARSLQQEVTSIVLPCFRKKIEVETKADASPVTLADKAVEAMLREALMKEFPEDGFLGEETGERGRQDGFLWVIDPIDGTRAFISGNPLFGCLIGCVYGGKPVLGVCSLPALEDDWWAMAAGAAMLNGTAVRVSETVRLADATLATTSPDLFSPFFRAKFDNLKKRVAGVQYGGDCFNYLALASGWLDIVFEAGLKAYDILPLVPIIEAAGGVITDMQGMPLRLQGHTPLSQEFNVVAASSKMLHKEAMGLLQA